MFRLYHQLNKVKEVKSIAIYHLESKIISRGSGRSAVAASAYMSCSRMLNDYDGVQHDYRKKQGLVWQQIFLPDHAPVEWKNREILWNAVEEAEKSKDSRLAREVVVALPVELQRDEWINLLTGFIQKNFVADGMCADVAIHDTDGHNPHAHIMLTIRPLTEKGTWQHKTEKEYLCIRSGEERGFTAVEFQLVQAEGWEKQYQYKVGKKKVYMTPSAAKAEGLERVSKYPKSTKYGRQNPVAERWNSEEQLLLWRKTWADVVNQFLEYSESKERVDCHSHAKRGLDEQPTVHEGVIARAMERKGIISDRYELNHQIKADNILLRTLKAQVCKLTEVIQKSATFSIDTLEKLENLRKNMLIFYYQLLYIKDSKAQIIRTLKVIHPNLERYTAIVCQIKTKSEEFKKAFIEKKTVPLIQVFRHRKLAHKITTLTEDIEELRSEKVTLLNLFECTDDTEIEAIRERVTTMEATLQMLNQQEEKYSADLSAALIEYNTLVKQVEDIDSVELIEVRRTIRTKKEHEVSQQLRIAYEKQYDNQRLERSRTDVSSMLGEKQHKQPIYQQLRQLQEKQTYRQSSKKQEQKR